MRWKKSKVKVTFGVWKWIDILHQASEHTMQTTTGFEGLKKSKHINYCRFPIDSSETMGTISQKTTPSPITFHSKWMKGGHLPEHI